MDKWLAEHCHLRETNETFEGAIPDFLKWKEQFRQDAGETQLSVRFSVVCRQRVMA